MADEIKNYENIDIPYNTYLSRGEITTPEGSLDSSNGTKEEEIKSGDSLNDLWIRNFIRSENWSPKKKGFFLNGLTGYAEFSNVFISGNIEALTGTIGGFTIGATSLSATSGGNTTTLSSGTTAFSAGPTGTPTITITQAGAVTASNITITGGSVVTSVLSGTIAQTNLNLADRGWTQTSAFSVTDADTVAWGAGTLTSADGTAYSIGAGDTGNMVSKTYVYLDIAISTIAYQTTTTATTAVGVGKVLIAIAQNGTSEATYKVLQGQGGENIDAANIVAGSITANEIAASTITAGKMGVTDLSAISANIGAITAGSISVINGGYTIGLTPSGSNAIFSGTTGSPEFKVTLAGFLTATSGVIGGWTIGSTTMSSATSGERIILDSGNKKISLINSSETEILKFNYNATTTQAIQLINIKDNDKRGIEFIVESTRGGSAKCITIDNPSNSISIDMTDAGSTGINIAGASISGIVITHSGTGAGIDISGAGSAAGALTIGGGDYPSIDINQNGTATNSFGIRIAQDTNALKDGIFINNDANSQVSKGMYIDRDLSADNQIGVALRIECTNTGIGGKACGIDFTGATIQAIMNVAADATDPTGGGGAALGRIPIYVAGVLRYLAYYT